MKLNINEVISQTFKTVKGLEYIYKDILKSFKCKDGELELLECYDGSLMHERENKNGDFVGYPILKDCFIISVTYKEGLCMKYAFTELEESIDFSLKIINILKA